MPVLKAKNSNGVWEEVAGVSGHKHTMNDVTDFPSSVPADVEALKEKVGELPVAEQIATAVNNKADKIHTHSDLELYNTVTGYGEVSIVAADTGANMTVKLSSDTYSDFSNIRVNLNGDGVFSYADAQQDGTVNGLTSISEFTLSLSSGISGFDASKVQISCTHLIDVGDALNNYVLNVDEDFESGSVSGASSVFSSVLIDDSLSIKGAAADAYKTGSEINTIKNRLSNVSSYTHPSTHPASMITGLATVATSGSYNDLTDKPDITGADIVVSDTYDATSSEAMSGKAVAEALQTISVSEEYVHPESHPADMITGLATVATSGDYNDLTNKPTIPSIEGLATETYVNEQIAAIEIPEQAQQVQADWAETDATSPAYIKNKPSISADGTLPVPQSAEVGQYLMVSGVDSEGAITSMTTVDTAASDWETMKNKPFGEIRNRLEIVPLTRCENFVLDSNFEVYCYELSANCHFEIGEKCTISWDGVEYTCEAIDVSQMYDGNDVVGFGNGTAFDYPGNNEPFVILCNNMNGSLTFICLTHREPCAYHDVSIYQESVVIKRIDKEFLPDMNSKTAIIEETELPLTLKNDSSETYGNIIISPAPFVLTADENYMVVLDGREYECTARTIPYNETNIIFIGDEDFGLTNEWSGEYPFAVAYVESDNAISVCVRGDATSVNVSLYHVVNDEIATQKYVNSYVDSVLPKVTVDDAGKFLRVSSLGVWAVESIPSAEGASF